MPVDAGNETVPLEIRRWLGYVLLISLCINFLLLAPAIYMLQVYDRVLLSHSVPTLAALTLVTVLLVVTFGVLDTLRSRVLLRAGLQLERNLGCRVLERLHRFGVQTPHSISRRSEAIRDLAVLRGFTSGQQFVALCDIPWVPFYTLLIFGFSWILGLVALVGMAILAILALVDEKLTFRRFTEAHQDIHKASQFALSSASNAEVVHALGLRRAMTTLWLEMRDRAVILLKQASDRGAVVSSVTKTMRILLQISMLGIGAYLVLVDNLPSGVMIASTVIVARAVGPLEVLISGWRAIAEARSAYSRVESLLREEDTETDGIELPALAGGITAEGVHFGFGSGKPLLSNASFRVEPGEIIGVVGPSSSGKSTLIRLMLGILRPHHGRILLGDYDIGQYNRDLLGPQLGYLPQNVEIFPGTVALNISRMQNPTLRSEEILAVAAKLGIDKVINRFASGFDTVLADQGQNLSGGQRQLIGLARAFYGSPRIVVLDEPDSNLDQISVDRLLALIDEIHADKRTTLIVVTHSQRIIDRMDRLLLVKDGSVASMVREDSKLARAATPGVRKVT